VPLASTRTARIIRAPREALYAAFLDPAVLVQWLPPGERTGVIHEFDGRVGGGYRMSLYYPPDQPHVPGKTTDHEDQVRACFVDLTPPRRIIQTVAFAADDPALEGEMTMMVTFEPAPGGTEVTLLFEHLPPGLKPEDNDDGARLSLDQLARRFE
jgi:uncharacterized protein YndB with AHSA1/START domain